MARARNIKPAFFQNEELGELQPIERLAFIGMWTIADFRGCIELKLKRLKIQLLPYDDCNIEKIVKNLEQSRFIRVYSVQGQHYIKIINFEKHQNPHKNERDSGSHIPDISEGVEIFNEINDLTQDGTKTDLIGTTRADPLSLIPSSLIPDSLVPQKEKATRGARLPTNFEPDFDFAKQNGVSNPTEEFAKFRDYWNSQAGAKAVKTDWQATWRNWCRNSRKDVQKDNYEPRYAKYMREKMEQISPSIAAKNPNNPVKSIDPNEFLRTIEAQNVIRIN